MKRTEGTVNGSAKSIGDCVRRCLRYLPEILSAAGIAAILGAGLWIYFLKTPCRVEADCRGRGIDVEQMRQWEEQEKEGHSGIRDMAGWRIEKQQTVSSVSTGRRKPSAVIAVYGDASLVCPADILSGVYALPYAGDEQSGGTAAGGTGGGTEKTGLCILTGELSDALFGSCDTAGELVRAGDELLAVAGVIDMEGCCLLRSASDGSVEYAAFRLTNRWQAEEKLRQRIGFPAS